MSWYSSVFLKIVSLYFTHVTCSKLLCSGSAQCCLYCGIQVGRSARYHGKEKRNGKSRNGFTSARIAAPGHILLNKENSIAKGGT